MRSAPPLQVSVNHFGVWRAIVLLLGAGACASMFAWWWTQPLPVPTWATGATAIGALASLACVAGLWPTSSATLRWDRERWRLAWDGASDRAGALAVALDLGGWMLLRFVPESMPGSPGRWRRCVWIALQRRGLEAQWHALRCALFAARPALRTEGGAVDA